MSRTRIVAAWVVAVLLALSFLAAGINKFGMQEGWIVRFARWGYPAWFVSVIGVLETLGGVLVLSPRLSLYGAGLLAVIMLGAAYTHAATGIGSPFQVLVPLVLCSALVWLRWPLYGLGRRAEA